jgi:hypothetical protein
MATLIGYYTDETLVHLELCQLFDQQSTIHRYTVVNYMLGCICNYVEEFWQLGVGERQARTVIRQPRHRALINSLVVMGLAMLPVFAAVLYKWTLRGGSVRRVEIGQIRNRCTLGTAALDRYPCTQLDYRRSTC